MDQLPFWTLQHRVASWNYLFTYAKYSNNKKIPPEIAAINYGLSPFLVTAYSYLMKFYHNPIFADPEHPVVPEKDLFLMTLLAEFVATKQIGFGTKLEMFINENLKRLVRFNDEYPGQIKIMGRSMGIIKELEETYNLKKFASDFKTSELYLLTYMNWDLQIHNPFSYLNNWIGPMRSFSDKSQKLLSQFRKMRGRAVRYIITLLIYCDDPSAQQEIYAAAAIQAALTEFPIQSFSTEPEDDDFWINVVKAEVDIDDLLETTNIIPDALKALEPYRIEVETIRQQRQANSQPH